MAVAKTKSPKKTVNSKPQKVAECQMPARGQRKSHAKNGKCTKIVVKCNCGFPNNLYIRGEGIKGLSWEKGTLMHCTKSDEWVWETDAPFSHGEVKIVLNDKQYELGENHEVDCGSSINFTPKF